MKFFHAQGNGVCHTTVYKDCSQPELIKSINRDMQSRPSCHYGKPLSVTERCFSWMMLEFFRCWNSFSELMRHHNWNSTDRNSGLYLIHWHQTLDLSLSIVTLNELIWLGQAIWCTLEECFIVMEEWITYKTNVRGYLREGPLFSSL